MQPVLAYPGSGLLCTFLPLQQCTLIQQCMLIQQSCLCSFKHFSCCCTNAKAVCLVSRPQYQGPQPLSLLSTQALVVMAHCADVPFFASDRTSPMWPCLDVAIIARRFGYIQQFISSICHAQPFMQKRQQQHCWHAASAGGWPIIGRELYMGRGNLLHFIHAIPRRHVMLPQSCWLCCDAASLCLGLQAIQHKQVEGYIQRAFKDRLQVRFSDWGCLCLL